MDEQEVKMPVNTVLYPTFYRDFKCLAAGCRDHCCGDWNIEFNKKDYLKLRHIDAPPDVKKRLDGCVKRLRGESMYAEFHLNENKNCPMLDSDHLCALQKACGHDALPFVCKIFPRCDQISAAAKELSLSPACEAVMKRLWDLPDGIDFIEDPITNPKDYRAIRIPEDARQLAYFPDIRSFCIDILQNRRLTMRQRMLFLGIFLQGLIDLDWNQPEIYICDLLDSYAALSTGPEAVNMLSGLQDNTKMLLSQNIKVLGMLRPYHSWADDFLTSLVKSETEREDRYRLQVDANVYEKCKTVLAEKHPDFEIFLENLIVTVAWWKQFPRLWTKEDLWEHYVELCNIYSFYRFCAVMQCGISPDKDELIHILVMVSRVILHSRGRQVELRDELFKNDSASLAHMAILVGE